MPWAQCERIAVSMSTNYNRLKELERRVTNHQMVWHQVDIIV